MMKIPDEFMRTDEQVPTNTDGSRTVTLNESTSNPKIKAIFKVHFTHKTCEKMASTNTT